MTNISFYRALVLSIGIPLVLSADTPNIQIVSSDTLLQENSNKSNNSTQDTIKTSAVGDDNNERLNDPVIKHAVQTFEAVLSKYHKAKKLTARDVLILKSLGFVINTDIPAEDMTPELKNAIKLFESITDLNSFGIDAKSVEALLKSNALINPTINYGPEDSSWKAYLVKRAGEIYNDSVEMLSVLKVAGDSASGIQVIGLTAASAIWFTRAMIGMPEQEKKSGYKLDANGRPTNAIRVVLADKPLNPQGFPAKIASIIQCIPGVGEPDKPFKALVMVTAGAATIGALSQRKKIAQEAPKFMKKNFPTVYEKMCSVKNKVSNMLSRTNKASELTK